MSGGAAGGVTAIPDARGVTARLARFAAELRWADLPAEAQRAVARHLLDTLGAIVAGGGSEVTEKLAAVLRAQGGAGAARVPGRPDRWQPLAAAYLGGTAAHGLEVDDGYRAGSVHPGAVVVPAVLAAAEGRAVDGGAVDGGAVDGDELGCAIAVGYEVAARVAGAIHPQSRRSGYHNTPVVGVLGAAAACASLLRLDARACESAIGLAASSAAGIFAFLHGGGEVKRLHAGMAAREGLLAALLAAGGIAGPRAVLESQDGFLQVFGGGRARSPLAEPEDWPARGSPLMVTRCYVKPYACCRHIHPALDAALDLRERHGDEVGRIVKIEARSYAIAAAHAAGGWEDFASAQLSYQFCLASALRFGAVGMAQFSEAARRDPETEALCRLVEVGVDEEAERDYPNSRTAELTVTFADGSRAVRRVSDPLGSPDNPLPRADLEAKFLSLAGPVLGERPARELAVSLLGRPALPAPAHLLSLVLPTAP